MIRIKKEATNQSQQWIVAMPMKMRTSRDEDDDNNNNNYNIVAVERLMQLLVAHEDVGDDYVVDVKNCS